ncbi:hypothetical protein BDA96_02G015200 [Sorghum bicolor]|uniref:F-box domain-containing protein n=1 Tax=Sorghum bicolor TaxID=4558 RepID=A0A921URB6_SORBI|nr:hypothetical protein BDA96_02G015200 [Sorghum bicolor]
MSEPSLPPPPPPSLMEELIEEILLRLPPQEPASLFRAALVCKPWRRLVTSPRFQRRFREFHRRTPPMLGFLCDNHGDGDRCSFVRTTASSPLHATTSRFVRPLDARHGRVLLREPTRNVLVVWDPITDDRQVLPVLPRWAVTCTAAVLCGAGAGACDHHDCHRGGSFLVVFVGTDPRNMFVCTYDSSDYFAAWSEPISLHHLNDCYIYAGYSPAVLLGNELYLGIPMTNTALKYDLELCEISWIQLPTLHYCDQRSVLTTTEDGLGLISLLDGKLCMWLRMDNPEANNAGWTQFKTIDFGSDPFFTSDAFVVGFADGLDIVFVTVNGVVCTVDLKTYVVKKVYNGRGIHAVFPYMRFYSPELEANCLGDEELCSWI